MMELQAEPGHEAVGGQGVEPQGDFRQLHRHRVQVHPEDVVVGEIHLDLLLLGGVVLLRDALAARALHQRQVLVRKRIDGLVQERGAAHGRLADGE
ncbi:MAG: hypothetical protein L0H73_12190, partial [Nitrococcus sp.]|nr:hypothetical protein [Nitrococcus sp.]